MEKILRALYDGEIAPIESYRPYLEEHISLGKAHARHYHDFIAKLGSPLDSEFIRIMDEHLETLYFDHAEAFIDGFRLGARIMLEVFDAPPPESL